jgi:hypothetical protein
MLLSERDSGQRGVRLAPRVATNRGGEVDTEHQLRPSKTVCTGVLVVHRDGTRSCSAVSCSGEDRHHGIFAACGWALGDKCPRCFDPDG